MHPRLENLARRWAPEVARDLRRVFDADEHRLTPPTRIRLRSTRRDLAHDTDGTPVVHPHLPPRSLQSACTVQRFRARMRRSIDEIPTRGTSSDGGVYTSVTRR
jgi:hypothetical protein